MELRVRHLWRHPIKGHGVEEVPAAELAAGATMPWDRVWAIADARAKIDANSTDWAHSVNFSRGAKSPQLMAIRAQVDEVAGTVTLTHPAQAAITVNPDLASDMARLIAWVTPLTNPERPAPSFVVRGRVGVTDSEFPSIALNSLASLEALAERVGKPLAMERFRGNVWLDGLAPFEELNLVGRRIRIGDAVLAVREGIVRCLATTVDPDTGVSDADTLGALRDGWGHKQFGVYAEVIEGGRVAVGDPAQVVQ